MTGVTFVPDADKADGAPVSSGGGAQTPWTSSIDAGGFALTGVGALQVGEDVQVDGALIVSGGITGTLINGTLSDDGGGSGLAVTFRSGINTAKFQFTDEGFGPGYPAPIGSYGVNIGDGAYVKYGVADDEWGKLIFQDKDGVVHMTGIVLASAYSLATADTGWSATNVSSDKVFNANATTVDELADVLGTLIARLRVAFPGLVDA